MKILLILLGMLGILLAVTTIRGAFIIDEMNYAVNAIGLREGRLTVPGTEGLSPSNELLYFDPEPYNRVVSSTPVASIAPPLYAPLALPFVFFGWGGLAFLNTLSFLASVLLVFLIVRRKAKRGSSPWIAVSLFVLGGYSLEYAQGVWPHMLSVFLVVAALYCVSFTWERSAGVYAFLGGILMGLACGVRDQNVFLAGCLGLTVLVWANRRISSTVAFIAGIALPLLASAILNYYRLGVFYPSPKSYAYIQMVSNPVQTGAWLRPFEVFLVKIVDFSTFAWFKDPTQFVDYSREPSTGAFLVGGIVKKAFLQSSPWIALALVVGIVNWLRSKTVHDEARTTVRALSILVILPLAAFSMAGFRMDGLCFNQRYLLELVPFAAIIVALCLDGLSVSPTKVIVGSLLSAFSFAAILILFSSDTQHLAVLRVPLILGCTLVAAWAFKNRPSIRQVLGITLGLCIGWSFMVQIIDLTASRRIRSTSAVGLDSLSATIPNHSALFTFWGTQKSTAGPIQLDKDVVILDAWADMGMDASLLTKELLQQQRRVFVYGTGMPTDIVRSIRGQDSLAVVLTNPFVLYELIEAKHRDGSTSAQPSVKMGP